MIDLNLNFGIFINPLTDTKVFTTFFSEGIESSFDHGMMTPHTSIAKETPDPALTTPIICELILNIAGSSKLQNTHKEETVAIGEP